MHVHTYTYMYTTAVVQDLGGRVEVLHDEGEHFHARRHRLHDLYGTNYREQVRYTALSSRVNNKYTFTCMYLYLNLSMYLSIYLYIYIHIYIYIYIYTYMYMYTHLP